MNPPAVRPAIRRRERPVRERGSLDRVLIDAAMDLFAAYGYRGTSLARIARAAGVTKGALYWHFSGKQEFFLAVARKVLGEWNESFARFPQPDSRESYRREFGKIFEQMADLNRKNPWVTRLLLIIALESHKLGRRMLGTMRKANLQGFANFQRLIDRGKALGALDPALDSEWAATEIFSTYLGLAMLWYLHGERFDLRVSLKRQAADFLKRWSAPQ